MNNTDTSHRKGIVGNPNKPGGFWLYDSAFGFDLTHPETPTSPTTSRAIDLQTAALPVKIDPSKSALVIVDMQNFFLSPSLGRPPDSKGLAAQARLLEHAIPAARKAGIGIIWLNWGLTQDEIDDMPAATTRAFGFETVEADEFEQWADAKSKQAAIDSHGINEGADDIARRFGVRSGVLDPSKPRIYKGLGSDIGRVHTPAGDVDAGRLLMRESWNADLTPELKAAYEEGRNASPPDSWIHKNRMSGLWGTQTMATEFLEEHGIKTLFFAGVNTDQCVGGSAQDAFSRGYDVVLLSDGAATTSPSCAQEAIEFNCSKTWGFCMSCEQLWIGCNAVH